VDKLTSSAGGIIVNLSYDAFGKRRGSNWTGSPSSGDWTAINANTHRGYTDHEQLDNLSLIHLNGRVYDPAIGRFLSADPVVQAPFNAQSLNRYSYVFNNPLRFTDPSGFKSTLDQACQDICRLNWMLDLQRVVRELSPERTIAGDGAHGNDSRATPGAGGPDPMAPARPGVGGLGSVTPGLAVEGPRLSTVGGLNDGILPSFGRGFLGTYRSVVDAPAPWSEQLGRSTRQTLNDLVTVASVALLAIPGGQAGGATLVVGSSARAGVVALARDTLAGAPTVIGRIQAIPFRSGAFASISLEGLPYTELSVQGFREVARALTVGGRVEGSTGFMANPSAIRQMLQEAGFKEVEVGFGLGDAAGNSRVISSGVLP